MTTLVGVGII